MTEENFITEYLEKNYEVVTTSHSFDILDKTSEKKYPLSSFKIDMENIFMKISEPIIDKWFIKYSNLLIKDLNESLERINFTNTNTNVILADFITYFTTKSKTKDKYEIGFIKNVFFNYHKQHNIIPKLNYLINKINNSNDIMNVVSETMEYEPLVIQEFVLEYLNEWYSASVLGQKISDLFSQFVVTLGPRNWKVTWDGHGEVTRDKIKLAFSDENEQQIKIILQYYHQWYEEAIIEASERILKFS